jgi:para-aminobenzoate synthetase component 1
VEEIVSPPSALDAFERVGDLPHALLLDSGANPQRLGRYSFLAADPVAVVRSKGSRTELLPRTSPAAESADPFSAGSREPADPLSAARAFLRAMAAEPVPGIPPFQGGVAGYLGYDFGATLERLPAARYDDLAIPDVILGYYEWVVAWDHGSSRAWIVTVGTEEISARTRLTMLRERLAGPVRRPRRQLPEPVVPAERAPAYPVPDFPWLRSSFTHAGYLAAVQRVREYLLAGDIYQANLSQRLEAPFRGDPWDLYRRLRAINPAPFAAYFDAGDLVVASASPERFLRLTTDGAVETRPIKGTRPRGYGPEHDAALGQALTESEKDRAEHVMIVDLLRNDLSRVCALGSVRVPELFALERYATVHHLVSTIVGRLRPSMDAIDLIRAAFPGGSITGAPKIRAMEIIAELEPSARGVYCGSVGYLSCTGAADLSIVIRTYLIRGERVYFSVGGGIVVDSDPEGEYRETLDKAQALIAALEP